MPYPSPADGPTPDDVVLALSVILLPLTALVLVPVLLYVVACGVMP